MTNIQLGSLVLNTELLVALAAGIMGLLAVRLRHRRQSERDLSAAWNAMMIWIAVWKGSLLLTDAAGVIRQPLSLLYYDGGEVGFWFACVATAGYLCLRYGRLYGAAEGWAVTTAFASGWSSIYMLATIILDVASARYAHWLVMFVAIAAGFILVDAWGVGTRLAASSSTAGEGRHEASVRRWMMPAAGALLLLALLSYMAYDQTDRLLTGHAERQAGTESVKAREGHVAPVIELDRLNGDSVSLADYKGKTVLVNFWTTWCQVCKTEMPHVQKLFEHYQKQGGDVVILSVNVTSQEGSVKGVEQYVNKRELTFPIVLDSKGNTADAYRVAAYPSTFIIDGDGIVRERFLGAISYNDMKKRIERVQEKYPSHEAG
ncbi:TlpA family protein disulfide reductase [Paenibacillus sp. strain BS8-2]